jgi:TRAP-type C4-dicarboxylate transport system permease small subunit
MVPSVPTPPAAMVSAESNLYLGLLILAAFWAFFSGAVVAVSEREASRSAALGWVVSFVAASLVAAFCFRMLP